MLVVAESLWPSQSLASQLSVSVSMAVTAAGLEDIVH